MATDVWVSVLSLAGVGLGGGLTAFAQRATQRSAERAEERRQVMAIAEARRAEQIQVLKEFNTAARAAERAAYRRPEPWGDDEEGWMTQAQAVMTALWTASVNVMLLCDQSLHEPLRAHGRAVNQAVWRDTGGVEVNEHLEPTWDAFMAAAQSSLSST